MKSNFSANKKVAEGSSLRILTPPLRITLFTIIFLSIAGFIWAFFAKIPLQTRGTAIFLPSSGVSSVYAQTSGTLILYDPREIQPQWISLAALLPKISNVINNEAVLLEVAKKIILNNSADDRIYDTTIINNVNSSWVIKKNYLIARILDPGLISAINKSLQDYITTKSLNSRKANKLRSQVATYQYELAAQSEYLKGMQSLRLKQFVSQATILQQQATIANLKNQINGVQAQILQTRQDTYNKLTELYSSVIEYVAKAMYFSDRSARLDTVVSQTFNYIQIGGQIAITSLSGVRKPSTIPIVFSNKDAATVRQGQKVYLQLISQNSSNTNSRLVGTIKIMETFPSDNESLKNIVGSKPIADLLMSQYVSPTAGVISLDKDKNGNYVTSIPNDEEFQKYLQPQDTFQALVTTSYVRPIELVLPSLQRILGIRQIEPKPETSSSPK